MDISTVQIGGKQTCLCIDSEDFYKISTHSRLFETGVLSLHPRLVIDRVLCLKGFQQPVSIAFVLFFLRKGCREVKRVSFFHRSSNRASWWSVKWKVKGEKKRGGEWKVKLWQEWNKWQMRNKQFVSADLVYCLLTLPCCLLSFIISMTTIAKVTSVASTKAIKIAQVYSKYSHNTSTLTRGYNSSMTTETTWDITSTVQTDRSGMYATIECGKTTASHCNGIRLFAGRTTVCRTTAARQKTAAAPAVAFAISAARRSSTTTTISWFATTTGRTAAATTTARAATRPSSTTTGSATGPGTGTRPTTNTRSTTDSRPVARPAADTSSCPRRATAAITRPRRQLTLTWRQTPEVAGG